MTGQRMIDTVLFDIGGTLLDFESLDPRPYFAEGFRRGYEYLSSRGLKLPSYARYVRVMRWAVLRRYLWSWIVRREVRLLDALVPIHNSIGVELDPDTITELAWELYLPMRRAGVADPDARAALLELRGRGYKLGIISNTGTPAPALDRHLAEEDNLLEFFAMRVYSCEVGYMKPHRGIFEIALDRIGSMPLNTVYVGDKVALDVKGAGRLGMVTVLKSPTGGPANGRWRPDHIVRTLGELPRVLESYSFPCPSN